MGGCEYLDMSVEVVLFIMCISDYFRTLFNVHFSDQAERKEKEHEAYVYFSDYIEECEGG